MSRRSVLPFIVVAAVAAAAFLLLRRSEPGEARYREAVLTRGPIERIVSATGTLNPVDQVEVGTQVSGTIQRIDVDYNDHVRSGRILAQIDPALFRAAVSQAEATLEKTRVNAKESERALRRARELKEQGLLSEVELEGAEAVFDSRRADVRQAEAALELARVNLANTTITSPISGVVISRNVEMGQTVAASLQAPRLFQIARDLSEMELQARVDEADIGQVHEGQAVTFTVDSYPDDAFEGSVLEVRAEPIVESGVVSYVTMVRVPNPRGRLLPGMTANVTIVTATREEALRLPNAALRFRPRRRPGDRGGAQAAATPRGQTREGRPGRPVTVWVKTPEGGVEAAALRIGISDGTNTEVLEGPVQEGAFVVVGEMEAEGGQGGSSSILGGGRPSSGRGRRGGL